MYTTPLFNGNILQIHALLIAAYAGVAKPPKAPPTPARNPTPARLLGHVHLVVDEELEEEYVGLGDADAVL